MPLDDWGAALAQMDAALDGALRALDRREERWERAAAPSAGEGELAALARLAARLADWEARVRAAEELASQAEREIVARAAAVEAWRGRFATAAEVLQRG